MTLKRNDHNWDCPCATDAVEHGPTCADCDCGAVQRYKAKRRKKAKAKSSGDACD